MRFLSIFFLILAQFYPLSAQDFLQLYINEGIQAVQQRLEKDLTNEQIWREQLEGSELKFGYFQGDKMIIVVNKAEQKLRAYFYSAGKLSEKFEQKVITGLRGDKLKEGDLRTPVGAYDVLQKMTPPDIYYGPWAFVLGYPSALDRSLMRTGSGIWIHGFPLDGDVRYDAYKTKGCVVMTNDLLMDFEQIMKGFSGVVLINENEIMQASVEEISAILATVFRWKAAWANNDLDAYLGFYDETFKRPDGSGYRKFSATKRAVFGKNERKQISFKNIEVMPYPNSQNERIFRVKFYEDYETKSYQFHGNKEIYLKFINNSFKIIAED